MKIGSLFAGIGGIDLGFKQAGFEVAWANEFDSDACKTYRLNFPDTKLIEADVRKIDFSIFEPVDVITAGFPCQSFSVCGKKKGFNDDRGNLFFEIIRAVDTLNPSVIFLENVSNLTKHDNGRSFNIIHNELASRDYYIKYLIADACDYGFPQHRTRIYIIAFKNIDKCNSFSFPNKSKLTTNIFNILNKTEKQKDSYYLKADSWQYKKMSAAIKDDQQIYRFSDFGIQSSKDGICFTLKANMGTWHDRVPIIKDNYSIRTVTPEECLALMGFPSTFIFPTTTPQNSLYKQVGNSVIVPLVRKLSSQILKP